MTKVSLSRIDKLTLDSSGVSPAESLARRQAFGAHVAVGTDVAGSQHLQVVLLTIVNLGIKSFGRAAVYAQPGVLTAPNLTALSVAATLEDAVLALGGTLNVVQGTESIRELGQRPHLIIGDAQPLASSVRVTFDGWCAGVGPASDLRRMAERPFGPPAWVAAAALGVSELFSACFGINIRATRQVVRLSLWSPAGADGSTESAVGRAIPEAPAALSLFGLGHLGQAYLWSIAALPYVRLSDVEFWLCDDDAIEPPNIETSALLSASDVGRLKTRAAAQWLEHRGASTRLMERRIDASYRVASEEPAIALSGFDKNLPRHWLAHAGFQRVFDAGLGGEAENFDSISYRMWPNSSPMVDLWPLEEDQARRENRRRHLAQTEGYVGLAADECGRVTVAGASVAVPFVGALAASTVVAEMLKCVNGAAHLTQSKMRGCLLGTHRPTAQIEVAPLPIRGLVTAPLAQNR